jgi:hypothetical protein
MSFLPGKDGSTLQGYKEGFHFGFVSLAKILFIARSWHINMLKWAFRL